MPSLPDNNKTTEQKQKNYNSTLNKGNLNSNLIKLAWPQIGESLFWFIMTFVDLIWIGKLGIENVAIVGTGQIITFVFFSLRTGLDTATRALISRALGQNRSNYAKIIFLQSLFLAIAYSSIIIIFIRFFLESTLTVLKIDPILIPKLLVFMTITGFTLLFFSMQSTCSSAIQASGNSITPAKIEVSSRILHIILSPLLIFGILFSPELGVYGIAVAMLISRTFGTLCFIKIIESQNSIFAISFQDLRLNTNIIKKLTKIGVPSSLIQFQRGFLQIAFLSIVSTQGIAAISAYSVMRRLELLLTLTTTRLGSVTGIIVGHNLSINQIKRSKTVINIALLYIFIASIAITILVSIFSNQISGFISKDPEFIRISSLWLITVGLGCIPISGSNLLATIISSAGRPNIPILISIIITVIIELPIAIILSQILKIEYFSELAIPIAIVIAATIRFIMIWIYEKSDHWIKEGLL